MLKNESKAKTIETLESIAACQPAQCLPQKLIPTTFRGPIIEARCWQRDDTDQIDDTYSKAQKISKEKWKGRRE
jgi:hypothetical protein